jgi:hypothetical protein
MKEIQGIKDANALFCVLDSLKIPLFLIQTPKKNIFSTNFEGFRAKPVEKTLHLSKMRLSFFVMLLSFYQFLVGFWQAFRLFCLLQTANHFPLKQEIVFKGNFLFCPSRFGGCFRSSFEDDFFIGCFFTFIFAHFVCFLRVNEFPHGKVARFQPKNYYTTLSITYMIHT